MIISLSGLHLVGRGYIYPIASLILRMGASSYVVRHNTVCLGVIGLMYKRFYFRNSSAQKWWNIHDIYLMCREFLP